MIRKFLCTILMTTIVFAGCGANKDSVEEKDKTDVVQDASATNAEESVDAQSTSEETQEDTEEEELLGVIGKITQSDKDKSGLYTAFLNNEETASIDGIDDPIISNELGDSCKIMDIFDNFYPDMESEYTDEEGNTHQTGNEVEVEYSYIDCGQDGEFELVFSLHRSYMSNVVLVKEKEDKLYIKFYGEDGDRSYSGISSKGYYSLEGNSGADVRSFEYGYFDKDAEFHFFYSADYYLYGPSFFEEKGLSVDEGLFENMQIESFCFDEYKNNPTIYYNYGVVDENGQGFYESADDPGYADGSSVYMKEFEKIGVKPLPRAEIKKVLEKRAKDIGLSLDIIPEDEL